MRLLRLSLFLTSLIVSACSPPLQYIQPPTPQTVRITYPPSLWPLTELIQSCFSKQADAYFILEEFPYSPIEKQAELYLWPGEKPASFAFAYPFGKESLSVVTNPKNPLDGLTVEDIHRLYAGEIENWKELGGEDRPVSVWIYPEGDVIQRQFTQFLDGDRPITPLAFLASSPNIIKEAIASDPGAIGFLPNAWIDADLMKIQLDMELSIPLLALSRADPDITVQAFIACLQSPQFQSTLESRYRSWNEK
jgi:hypothetical protein